MSATRYPHIEVNLIGINGNVFNILGHIAETMRLAGVPLEDRKEFWDTATSQTSYDDVLGMLEDWVAVTW